MKFSLGNLVLVFVLFWLLALGNYHAYTHLAADGVIPNCNHLIWNGLMMIALTLDVAILFGGFIWLLCANFWNKEIDLDKLGKNDD